MSELRRDPVLGRWVIVNTDDSQGPEAYPKESQVFRQKATCPFCPGRESRTPNEIEAVRYDGSFPNTPGWAVRVMPNKFPALSVEGELQRKGLGLFDMINGIGAHEVIVETPDHEKDFPEFTSQQMYEVVNKYCNRAVDLARDNRFKYVMIFKNYGRGAGASLEHAHSQVIALPMAPKYVLQSLSGAQSYYEAHQRCIYCDIIAQERKDRERIVMENEHFICFAHYTSRFPFETWIMPKDHSARFSEISNDKKFTLGNMLKEIITRNRKCLDSSSYNFFIHTSPSQNKFPEHFHWHVEIIPKLTNMAGFEWGTGIYVVSTSPAHAAKLLREVHL